MAEIVEQEGKFHVEHAPLCMLVDGKLESRLWRLDVGFRSSELLPNGGLLYGADLVSFNVTDPEATIEIDGCSYAIGKLRRVRVLPKSACYHEFRVHHNGGVVVNYYNRVNPYTHFRCYHKFGDGYLVYEDGSCKYTENPPTERIRNVESLQPFTVNKPTGKFIYHQLYKDLRGVELPGYCEFRSESDGVIVPTDHRPEFSEWLKMRNIHAIANHHYVTEPLTDPFTLYHQTRIRAEKIAAEINHDIQLGYCTPNQAASRS